MLKDTEANFKRESQNLSLKIDDLRMENNRYAVDLKKTAAELTANKDTFKNQINKQIEEFMEKKKGSKKDKLANYQLLKEELESIKRRLGDFTEFKKDKKSPRSSGINMPKVELKKNSSSNTSWNTKYDNANLKSIEQEHKKTLRATSYLKDYISGNSFSIENKAIDSEVKKFNSDLTIKESFNMERISNLKSHSTSKESIDCTPKNSSRLLSPNNALSARKVFSHVKEEEENEEELNADSQTRVGFKLEGESCSISKAAGVKIVNLVDENNYFNSENYGTNNINNNYSNNTNDKQNNLCDLKARPQTNKNLPVIIVNNETSTQNENVSAGPNKKKNASSNTLTIIERRPQTQSKYKEKFPLNCDNVNNVNININNNNKSVFSYDWSMQKTEKEDLARKELIDCELENLVSKIDSCLNSPNFNSTIILFIKEFAYVLSLFNQNFFLFKRDFMKKQYNTEQRTIQLENYSKKKLEELSDQIKIHIPISFNAYIKGNNREMPVERSINISNSVFGNINLQNYIMNDDLSDCRYSSAFGEKFSTYAGKNSNLKNNKSSNNNFINNTPAEKKTVKNFYVKTGANFFQNPNNMNSKAEWKC